MLGCWVQSSARRSRHDRWCVKVQVRVGNGFMPENQRINSTERVKAPRTRRVRVFLHGLHMSVCRTCRFYCSTTPSAVSGAFSTFMAMITHSSSTDPPSEISDLPPRYHKKRWRAAGPIGVSMAGSFPSQCFHASQLFEAQTSVPTALKHHTPSQTLRENRKRMDRTVLRQKERFRLRYNNV